MGTEDLLGPETLQCFITALIPGVDEFILNLSPTAFYNLQKQLANHPSQILNMTYLDPLSEATPCPTEKEVSGMQPQGLGFRDCE